MSLVIVSDTLPPDRNGVALVAANSARILANTGSTTLLGPRPLGFDIGPAHFVGVRRSRFATPDYSLPSLSVTTIWRLVAGATRVVVHTPGPIGFTALLAARAYHKPATLFVHNDLGMVIRRYM